MERKHVCILPKGVQLEAGDPSSSTGSRFLRLPHPRTNHPALFLPYSRTGSPALDGLLEVQKIELDADKQRCWFIEEEVASDGSLTLFSPFDPIYLTISYLSSLPSRFQSYSDLWESIAQHRFEVQGMKKEEEGKEDEGAAFAEDLGRLDAMEGVKERLKAVCETQEHESTTLYRLSEPLILSFLRSKVDSLVDPASGIFGPLEATEPGEEVKPKAEGVGVAAEEGEKFQTVRRGMAKEDIGSGHGLSEQIQTESRQKYAVGILANYLPPSVTKALLASYSFSELDAHLSTTTNSSVLNSTYLPGRGAAKLEASFSGELGGGAAAKKRKAEQSKGSRGVEALKKVNTKGMKSLKDLFGKQSQKAVKKVEEPAEENAEEEKPAKKKRKV
ncbi:Ribonuclease H2 subunit B [Rhodotorula toruloides]|uniref:Ribonuclease H2 subunit B n=1 Tax=Rhodotorula toruloides TaxID=5286 RepID=A0A0K3CBX7_RHOTO|nr:Ribonuclease H2 subunit B [Rhodotorula toruloides]PRQ76245.1 Ribonuclease H2, subunit B [Rhodotorula toruloides]